MAGDWTWGGDKKAVAVTEQDMHSMVSRIVEAMSQRQEAASLEQLKQYVRVEAELAKERENVLRLQNDINALQAHILRLNNFIATMTPAAGHPGFGSYGPAVVPQQLSTFESRVAATVPVPSQLTYATVAEPPAS